MLVHAGVQWKQFKNKLTSKFVRKDLIEAPPPSYSWIEQEDWNQFIQYRTTEEFQEISAGHRKIHSEVNKYPRTMSCHGYVRMKKDLIKQRSSESDETVSTNDMSELWSIGRRKYDGSYITKDAGEIAGNFDSLSQSATQGDIHPSRMDDILSIAMSTTEHSGRVRGVGHGVGIKKYFKTSRRHKDMDYIETEIQRRVQIEMAKLKEEMGATIREEMNKMYESQQLPVYGQERRPPPSQASASDSCPMSDHLSSMPVGSSMMCQLAIEDSYDQVVIVAHAKVFAGDASALLHKSLLGQENVKASIVTPLIPDAPLPFPLAEAEIYTVVQAVGSFVAWPKRLVISDIISMPDKDKKVVQNPTKGSVSTEGSVVGYKEMEKKSLDYIHSGLLQ